MYCTTCNLQQQIRLKIMISRFLPLTLRYIVFKKKKMFHEQYLIIIATQTSS